MQLADTTNNISWNVAKKKERKKVKNTLKVTSRFDNQFCSSVSYLLKFRVCLLRWCQHSLSFNIALGSRPA